MEERILEELINKQLEPYNKKYEDVKSDAAWTLKFETTKEDQQKFMDWAAGFLIKEMKFSRKLAETEIMWFILNHGIVIESELSEKFQSERKG